MPLADIAAAVATLQLGRPVIVVDDENRENEGDIIMAAEHATPGMVGMDHPLFQRLRLCPP